MDSKAIVDRQRDELRWALSWASEEGWLLRLIFSAFEQTSEWPDPRRLQRQLLRQGDRREVIETVRYMPISLGRFEPSDQQVSLRVRGLYYCPAAEALLDQFITVLRLIFKRYLEAESPILERGDLEEFLGPDRVAEVDRLSAILLGERWLFGSGSGSARTGWSFEVSEAARHLDGVDELEAYLAVESALFPGRDLVPAGPARPSTPQLDSRPTPDQSLSPEPLQLHPRLTAECARLIDDGHYIDALRRAAIIVRDAVREASGCPDLDGIALMGNAFGGSEPAIVVADLRTREGRSEQEGLRRLAQGTFQAIRNPAAHRHIDLGLAETLESLAVFSLLLRRIERGQPAVEPADSGA
jgi:uncharacterized protein (TIGR02391 family)